MTDESRAAAYLAALIDGEGHVAHRKAKFISIANTEWDIVQATLECCATLGLHHRVAAMSEKRHDRKPCWQVFITGKESLERVAHIVPMRSRRKSSALADAIAGFRKSPRPSREWLEQKYVFEGMSLQQVAEAWGKKSGVSACQWLKFYGIPARTLSEAATTRHMRGTRNG